MAVTRIINQVLYLCLFANQLGDMNEKALQLCLYIYIYEPRSKHAKTTLVKRGRFVHKTLQNDKVHLKTDNPSAVYDHKYATNSKHCKTIRSNSKPMTSIFLLKKNKEF